MTKMQEPSRDLWLWLFNEGGRYSVVEIAEKFQWSVDYATMQIYSMTKSNRVQKFKEKLNNRVRIKFGVTGLCQVPAGMTVAEVQA